VVGGKPVGWSMPPGVELSTGAAADRRNQLGQGDYLGDRYGLVLVAKLVSVVLAPYPAAALPSVGAAAPRRTAAGRERSGRPACRARRGCVVQGARVTRRHRRRA